MDANGQHFWLVRGGHVWKACQSGTLDVSEEMLRLASTASGNPLHERPDDAEERLARVPMARDTVGGRAWYDGGTTGIAASDIQQGPAVEAVKQVRPATIMAASALPGAVVIDTPTAPVTDLAMGPEGWLYIVHGGRIRVRDTRGRYPDADVGLAGFDAWRIAMDPHGGAWVLDRAHRQLARLAGRLWPAPRVDMTPAETFVPLQENPDPLRLVLMSQDLGPWIESGEDPVALACSPCGQLAVLLWATPPPSSPGDPVKPCARVRLVAGKTLQAGRTATLKEVHRPFSLAWLSDDRFAVMAPGIAEGLVYRMQDDVVAASGEFYPLRDHTGDPFAHGLGLPLEYPSASGLRPFVSLSMPAFPAMAEAKLAKPIDSAVAGMAWHRLYVEAEIPHGTSFTVFLAAFDELPDPAKEADDKGHAHHFGTPPTGPVATVGSAEPHAAWVPAPSEIPGFDGFMDGAPERGRSGLFTVLVQRSGMAVRTLRGRYLDVRIELRGNNRATPCIHAVRAYGPRFSYMDRYLPAVYREQVFGTDADQRGASSTRADFLGRFLANFEGILTPLEDHVAESWLLTEPRKTPDALVEWLAGWIGVSFEPWYPPERRREHLRRAPELFRWRGTFRGLQLALDVATGGGVLGDSEGRRRLVVVEDYWLRRTMATLLGVQLDKDFDPLLAAPVVSGNSKVGATLFINEGSRRELLSLFDASVPLEKQDEQAVSNFLGSMANRVTVLAHPSVSPAELALVQRLVELETPAHVAVRVRRSSHDFMVGMASMLGVDTYLLPPPMPEAVAVDVNALGEGPMLERLPSLDPRLEGVSP